MSVDILSRIGMSFTGGTEKRSAPDLGTRDIGGHFRNNQPYISGYFQVLFKLPEPIFMGEQASQALTWLSSTCEGFTPHSLTNNTVDVVGQGQIGASFVASVTTNREFTLTFREYQNMPILNVIRQWGAIMDPYTGVSSLGGEQFIPQAYKGAACVIQTKPTSGGQAGVIQAADIEELYVYNGVQVTNIPVDTAAASDITSNDTVQLSATFKFDGSPMTSAELSKEDVAKWFTTYKPENTYAQHAAAASIMGGKSTS